MDIVSPETRSRMMSGIRGKNTRPEILIRKLLFSAGYRYRLHRRDLPGIPDIVLPKYHAVIFVHGCFWHAHAGCHYYKLPKTNTAFWEEKLYANMARDKKNMKALALKGWRVLVVWECSVRDKVDLIPLRDSITRWLRSDKPFGEIPLL